MYYSLQLKAIYHDIVYHNNLTQSESLSSAMLNDKHNIISLKY